ncbi:MAG: cation-translocating P-type ATPase [Chitinophagaceae bacterium]|nr:cation-translocating P-type ATPase [Chitinophagaceae bacterium]
MDTNNKDFSGLADQDVLRSRAQHGANVQDLEDKSGFFIAVKDVVKEPMFILLAVASVVYFITGNTGDGVFMVSAIVVVSAISLYQDSRSRNALAALKLLTQPHSKVIRNGETIEINSEEIVLGDLMVVEEGTAIPADGRIVQSNDFSVNESILTGESLSVFKSAGDSDSLVYQGCSVVGGLAICEVVNIGAGTRLGKIGKSLRSISEEKTPLQAQISDFVKKMAIAGAIIFIIVWGINYFQSYNVFDSLLKALTLAMSILPEEIPVAFTTFMALGAWRLMKMGVIVKQTKTVESLGSATVICVDKTGTITENKMMLIKLFVPGSNNLVDPESQLNVQAKALIRSAMFASEPIPFDPMEIELHHAYARLYPADERAGYKMIHEYPLSGRPPMMTHIFEDEAGKRIIAAKGAPEAIIRVSELQVNDKVNVDKALQELTALGYRVLAVAESNAVSGDFPKEQQQFPFIFRGLVAFYDPPKKNISRVFESFTNAGITVKIITGDNEVTTRTIAGQVNFKGADASLGGEALQAMSDQDLQESVKEINMFTRMFPEAKLRVIEAMKANGEVVAMTGDGVNDGPALKSAHIGIAMGKKGAEIAKQASSIILTDDDLAKMVDAIAMGRRIYSNLKKAIQYIISIHIPIILTVFIPLALGWVYPNIFTPVHVIFLELIMGPTCSIIYENEPIEKNIMLQKPRLFSSSFFNRRELTTSIIQGLAITIGTLFIYQYAVRQGSSENITRTMVFLTLITANILLTLVNRSFYYSMITTGRYKNKLVPAIIAATCLLMAMLLFIPFLRNIFQFDKLNTVQLLICMMTGLTSVIWYELVKFIKRRKPKN